MQRGDASKVIDLLFERSYKIIQNNVKPKGDDNRGVSATTKPDIQSDATVHPKKEGGLRDTGFSAKPRLATGRPN
jgi:hypothetical protein